MKILSENPLIIAIVGFKGREGIYKEIKESEIPKKYRIEELGGAGAFNAYCFRSNTAGITSKKYFIKVDDILDFEPKKKNLLEQLNDENNMFNTNKVLNILKELNSEEKFIVSFDIENNKYTMTISRTLSENEIQVKEHKFEKYANDFKNLYRFEIRIPFDTLTKENVLELKEKYSKRRKDGTLKAIFKVSLDTITDIISTYDLNISENELKNCYTPFYNKIRL